MKVKVQVFQTFNDKEVCIDDMEVQVSLMDLHVASCIKQFGTTCKMIVTVIQDDQ